MAWYKAKDVEKSILRARERLESARVLSSNISDLVASAEGMSDEHWRCVQAMRSLLMDKLASDVASLVSLRDSVEGADD
jgi:hypothetical protein